MSNKTKVKIGMLDPTFVPIDDEPEGVIPIYKAATYEVSFGHAVKAGLSVTTDSLRVHGDDALQISVNDFKYGTLKMDALLDDLDLDAALYGSTKTSSGVTDNANDTPPAGAIYYIQKLLKKDKSIVYRAVVLFRCEADLASYEDDSETRGEQLTAKTNDATFTVYLANNRDWRWRWDYDTESAALAGIAAKLHPTTTP